jgi:glycosyltransferase involved in cell wall biosynthesis
MTSPTHSIVIPVYNEHDGIDTLTTRMQALATNLAPAHLEFILVNDGSTDGSDRKLDAAAANDPRFKVVHLSRNFGHQLAITAGMEWASGQTVTVIDADLQDPPELIADLIAKWREGFDVVYAVRRSRAGETRFKLWTASKFYRLIHRLTRIDIPMDVGDFRLMDRKVVDAFLRMRENHRFVRGMITWVGFRQIGIPYDRAERQFGESHYPLKKMIRFAIDGVTGFSTIPLQLATYLGVLSAVIALLIALWTIYVKFFAHEAIQGWTSVMLAVLFLGGAQLLALGIFGEYLGRTYEEVKDRPLYLVGKAVGFEREGRLIATPHPEGGRN